MKLSDKRSGSAKRFKPDLKFWTRILCLLLAVLMVILAAVVLLQVLSLPTYAYSTKLARTEDGTDYLVEVGLMYADGVTVGFETTAANGFSVCAVECSGTDKNHDTPLWQLSSVTKVSVVCDANLSKQDMTYSIATGETVAVGGYHLQVPLSAQDGYAGVYTLQSTLSAYHLYAFPAYINDVRCARIGSFATEQETINARATLAAAGIQTTVVSPSDTGVTVVDPVSDKILFEYDCGTQSALGLRPLQSGSEKTYTVTPAQNTYDGIFKYSRNKATSTEGVMVTNILPLEDYLLGVLPWECGTSCSLAVQRAFAIAARSYAFCSMGKHDNFDICNSTCCQLYKGLNRTADVTHQVVRETQGQVLVYNGTICRTVYSSSAGGTTVSAAQAWGPTVNYPYLTAIVTPWEEYDECYNGSWTKEYTPTQLKNRLRTYGYREINSDIVSVKIDSLCDNSTYVYSITFTDAQGHTATVKTSDGIRTTLGLTSGNFVVGKAGDTVTVRDYTLNDPDMTALITGIDPTEHQDVPISQGAYVLTGENSSPVAMELRESITAVTVSGMQSTTELSCLAVQTADGMQNFNLLALCSEDGESGDSNKGSTSSSGELPVVQNLVKDSSFTEHEIVLEGKDGSFVFVGRGWGHGVGMAQYGAMYLADLGYDHVSILKTYYQGTEIKSIKQILGY